MMSDKTKHSKLALVSTILPLVVWSYLGFCFLLFSWKPSLRFVDRIFGDSLGALGVVFILVIFLFGVIPIAGHLAGLICGTIGLLAKNKKRVFAVVGLILNALPLFAFFIYRLLYAVIPASGN